METFPWTTIGECSDIEVEDHSDVIKTQYSGGYTATRARNTRLLKEIKIKWDIMTPDEWNSLMDFWRDHYGGSDAFFLQYPYDLRVTGADSFGGTSPSSPPSGFDSGVSYGTLGGPIFTVRFDDTSIKQKMMSGQYWSASAKFMEV